MTRPVTLAGGAVRTIPVFQDPLEFAVHDVVTRAVRAAGLASIDDVDMVVTVASDILDGVMAATRSEIAGAYGREFLNTPSSAGHAVAAAAALIESGQIDTALVVGWGEGSKLGRHDSRAIQANPFYDRPVGAEPAAMAALQAQRLIADGRMAPPATAGRPAWLAPIWCDGAAALVLTAHGGGVTLRDFGVAFRPYCPAGDDLDPAAWALDALDHTRDARALPAPALIAATAPTPFCEARALQGVSVARNWTVATRTGSSVYFGPASGLQSFAAAREALQTRQSALVMDFAGPIGQSVTVAILEQAA